MRRLLALSWQYRARSLEVLACQVALLAVTLTGVSLTGLSVDVIRHTLDAGAPEPNWPLGVDFLRHWPTLWALLFIAGLVLGMAIIGAALNYLYSIQVGRLVHMEMVPSLREALYRKLQRLSFRFFDAHPSGAIINRVTRDVQMLRSFVDGVVIQGAVLLLSLSVFLAYMVQTHVWLTVVCMSLTPLLYVATVAFSRWARPAYLRDRELSDQMVRAVAESIEGIQVIKVFGRERHARLHFDRKNLAIRRQQRSIFRAVSLYTPLIDLLNHLSLAILMGYGAVLILRREITLGDLIVFAGLVQQFARRASNMATIVNTLQQSLTGARRVFEVLDQPLEVQESPAAVDPGRLQGEVSFEEVTFDYQQGIPALRGISLRVAAGECIGVMGASGSGKSTLLSLLPRFYDPTHGCVRIDGMDVKHMALDVLRRQIGVVFQETLLFRDTVRNNIAFGHPEASLEQVVAAAKRAGADEFIRGLEHGYDTMLEEGAVNLSGGQRQRLAIARALLLEPPILVFDDPTTAVDPTTENEVLSLLRRAVAGRTTFLVSGRLSTLRHADRIVVLDAGKIVEQGTHRELVKLGGRYAEAAKLQGLEETQVLPVYLEVPA